MSGSVWSKLFWTHLVEEKGVYWHNKMTSVGSMSEAYIQTENNVCLSLVAAASYGQMVRKRCFSVFWLWRSDYKCILPHHFLTVGNQWENSHCVLSWFSVPTMSVHLWYGRRWDLQTEPLLLNRPWYLFPPVVWSLRVIGVTKSDHKGFKGHTSAQDSESKTTTSCLTHRGG